MIAWVLTATLALSGPAQGDAAARAEAAFAAGDYATAAEQAEVAYASTGDPVYLYVQAQAERFGGRCALAIEHYRAFIAAVPKGAAANAARDNILECEQEVASSQPDPLVPVAPREATGGSGANETSASETTEVAPSPRPRVRAGRWFHDPWGGALVGVGVVTLGVGAGLYGQARADARVARGADDVATYAKHIDRAHGLSRAGVAGLTVGGALVVAGVVRWAVLARRGAYSKAGAVALSRGGITLRF